MFSKEYFKYLIKSNRYLILVIYLLYFFLILTNVDNLDVSFVLITVINIGLTYLLPMYIFSYVHDKKAVDTFYSLPISRKAMLLTGLSFISLLIFIPQAINVLINGFTNNYGMITFVSIFTTLLMIVTLVIFNTCIYLTANNMVDGFVMLGAYTFLPFALGFAIDAVASSFIAGRSGEISSFVSIFELVNYLSPISLSINSIVNFHAGEIAYKYIVGLLVILIIFTVLLFKSYINRKVERAGSPSDNFFAYPFIIYIYVTLSLLTIAAAYDYTYTSLGDFFSSYFIPYIILFAVFVVAHFVYKRKLYLSIKMPIFYVAVLILTLLFVSIFKNNNAFGLAYKYKMYDDSNYYLSIWEDYQEDVLKELNDLSDEGVAYYSVEIVAYPEAHKINSSTLEIFSKVRLEAIDNFYESGTYNNSHLSIYEKDGAIYEYYSLIESVDYDTLKELAKDKEVSITFFSNNGNLYTMNKDGKIVSEDSYEYKSAIYYND